MELGVKLVTRPWPAKRTTVLLSIIIAAVLAAPDGDHPASRGFSR
jgi:hypothetical protein